MSIELEISGQNRYMCELVSLLADVCEVIWLVRLKVRTMIDYLVITARPEAALHFYYFVGRFCFSLGQYVNMCAMCQ